MKYEFFGHMKRDEVIKGEMAFTRYDLDPDTKKETPHTISHKAGKLVNAQYDLHGNYNTNKELTLEQRFLIENTIKALILLKGEECVDAELITKFIKKYAGVIVKDLTIDKATKYYYTTNAYYAGNFETDKIDLTQQLIKNV